MTLSRRKNEKRSFLFMLMHSAIILVFGVVSFGFYLDWLERHSPETNRWERHRVEQAFGFLETTDEILSPKKKIIFLGASEFATGIDPISIDQEFLHLGLETVSFNFGFDSINPEIMRLMSRRLVATLKSRQTKSDLIVVKLSPARMTKAHWSTAHAQSNWHAFTDLKYATYNNELLLEDARQAPLEVMSLWFRRLVARGIPTESAASYLWLWITHGFQDQPASEFSKKVLFLLNMWARPEWHREPAWDPITRGSFFFEYKSNPDFLPRLQEISRDRNVMQTYYRSRARFDGIDTLEFDERLISDFINCLEILKTSSQKVVVFVNKEFFTLRESRESTLNLKKLVERLSRVPGIQVIDYSSRPELGGDDYFDELHFSLQGRAKFAKMFTHDAKTLLTNPSH